MLGQAQSHPWLTTSEILLVITLLFSFSKRLEFISVSSFSLVIMAVVLLSMNVEVVYLLVTFLLRFYKNSYVF